ncbi:T-box transcription factor TBX10-like [Dreissena polymorpha]|nr:T-box transcription factor TBX10-like [Dreissena polymorpha]
MAMEEILDLSLPKKIPECTADCSPDSLNPELSRTFSTSKSTSSDGSASPDLKRRRLLSPTHGHALTTSPDPTCPVTPESDTDNDVDGGSFTSNARNAPYDEPMRAPLTSPPTPTGGEPIVQTSGGVTIYLHDETLWREFAKYGTEMIINRGGRRMFPHIVLSIYGLDASASYSLVLQIVPADERRYKWVNHQWVAMGMADPGPEVQPVTHADSPNTGAFWMRNRTSFSKVRLTNNKESSLKDSIDGNILLLSMHKYKVVIRVKPEAPTTEPERVFVFEESAFVAVTAYQNSQITQLKIQNNPFAKAFRDAHNPSVPHPMPSKKRERAPKSKPCPESHHQVTGNLPSATVPETWPLPGQPVVFGQAGSHPAYSQMAFFDQMMKNMELMKSMEKTGLSSLPSFPVPPYIGNHSASLHGMRLPLSSPTISGGENSSPKLDEDTPSSTAT